MNERRVTMADLAAELGVSRSTVSNAFNRPDQLSDDLRARILDAAQARGYAGPDPRARTLRRGTTGAIGFLFDAELPYVFEDPAAATMLKGVARACQAGQVALVLVPRLDDDGANDVVSSVLVDGFIMLCTSLDDERRRIIQARQLPVVALDAPVVADEAFVGVDNRAAARAIADHVIAQGHRRIGVIMLTHPSRPYGGPLGTGFSPRDVYLTEGQRLAGYRDGVEAAGLDWGDVPVFAAETTIAEGRQAAEHLLGLTEPPTAILAMSDQVALGVLETAREHRLDVPTQLAVAGFDDIPDAERFGLTTIHQPQEEKGAKAVEILLHAATTSSASEDSSDEREGGGRQQLTVMPTELIVRASTTGPGP